MQLVCDFRAQAEKMCFARKEHQVQLSQGTLVETPPRGRRRISGIAAQELDAHRVRMFLPRLIRWGHSARSDEGDSTLNIPMVLLETQKRQCGVCWRAMPRREPRCTRSLLRSCSSSSGWRWEEEHLRAASRASLFRKALLKLRCAVQSNACETAFCLSCASKCKLLTKRIIVIRRMFRVWEASCRW